MKWPLNGKAHFQLICWWFCGTYTQTIHHVCMCMYVWCGRVCGVCGQCYNFADAVEF